VPQAADYDVEDLIPDEANVVTISNTGYIKRSLVKAYRQQKRAGKGVTGMGTKEEDYVVNLFLASSHDYILFFTNRGRMHWLKTYRIPEVGRAAKGKPIVNMLSRLDNDERVQAMIPVREFSETRFLVFATRQGVIKRTNLSAFRHVTIRGVQAIKLEAGDELIDVQVADGHEEVLLATAGGYANRFSITDVRPTGRVSTGVWGIRLYSGDEVVAMTLSRNPGAELLTVLASGFGKRTKVASYRKTRRGSHGVMTTNMKIARSRVVTVQVVHEDDALLVTTMNGMVIRCPVKGIRVTGRAAKGVRIMKIEDGDRVMAVARVISEKEEEEVVEAAEAAPPLGPPRPQPEIGPAGDDEDVAPEDDRPVDDDPGDDENLEL
jgi:DNA gyrase subunit A